MKWLLVLVSLCLCLLFLPMVLGPPVLSTTPAIESPTTATSPILLWVIAGAAVFTFALYAMTHQYRGRLSQYILNTRRTLIRASRPLRLGAVASAGLVADLFAK